MRVLLAEYAVAHDPSLAPEGAAMLGVLSKSFERCGYDVVHPEAGDFLAEIKRLAPDCDAGLVIAPDPLLFRYTAALESLTHNIGCGSMTAAVCANKQQTSAVLSRHGIPVPDETTTGRRVIKPVLGCGAKGVRLSGTGPGPGEFSQQFIDGEHLSVSMVGSRVVGNACSYYTGKPPLLLAVNRQYIDIAPDGRFTYLGGETPVLHDRHDELVRTAEKTITVLGCQGYSGVDIVLADRPYVVDVNPRITTSITGIAACMEEEIADILVEASKGGGPERVHLAGSVRFDTQGRVERL
ncbi:MAG: ATP-grasp domain-containing protein [Methanoregulaceae archaeon]|nr:ATP-grasp domain-containing protein [Methanoregulaceae archaeon]